MIALALRGIGQRKLRSALTAIAVLLGVAMIAGTYVLTDQIRSGFEDLQRSAYQGVDVEVTREQAFTSDLSTGRLLDQELIDRIREVEGVAAAEGQLELPAGLVVDGEFKESAGGGGTLIETPLREPFEALTDVDGRLPEAGAREVALLRDTADKHGIEIGDRVGVAARRGVQNVTVVGVFDFGDVASLGGTDLIAAPLADTQQWFDREGEVSSIVAAADEGVSDDELRRRVDAIVPDDIQVRTGTEAADETAQEINDQIGSFLTPALLAFAGAALLVGAFIIFNTFSITVAERTREFALLRTLGASRRQVLASVTAEALAIGALASAAGLLLGLAFARGLNALFEASGFGLPTASPALAPRTVVLALAIGIGVTLLAALAPALRATRVPPIAALQRSDQPPPRRRRKLAPVLAGLVTVLGVVLLLFGLFADTTATARLSNMGLGVMLLFIGVALSARWFVRPLAGAIGWPLQRAFAEPGLLARENAMRSPGRTAITAAALMVGLGLVVFVAVFANSLKVSITDSVGRLIKAELIVRDETFEPIPQAAADAIAQQPAIAVSASVYLDQIQVDGRKSNALTDYASGVDPATFGDVYGAEWLGDGSDELFDRLNDGRSAIVEEQFARQHDVEVGDSFEIGTATGDRARVTAIGKYRDPQVLQGMIVQRDLLLRISSQRDPFVVLADARDDADPSESQAQVERAVERFPTVRVESNAQYQETIEEELNQLVVVLYALLAMSVVISLFGIANSLFLSIHERTREFGLLRAVGATRAQVRRMVRYESVITSVIGGVLGTAIGVFFAYLVTQALGDLGLSFSVPAGQLVVFLLLAVVVGVVAAVMPARRGARLNVLDALRAE